MSDILRPENEPAEAHDVNIEGGSCQRITSPAKWNVDVVAKPFRQADMPSPPEIAGICGKIWHVEVQPQPKPEQPSAAPRDVGVTGKVAINLEREGITPQQKR